MKNFFNMASALLFSVALFSCEPAEQGYTYDYYLDNIYTVNKHRVIPEFDDTMLMVSNMDQFAFQTGDRVHMTLRNYYDSNTMPKPQLSIYNVVEVIPTLPLVGKESVDTAEYNALFNNLHQYEFLDRYAQPVWVWDNRQNINISFFGVKDDASFVMAVRGVGEDCVELGLYAKARRVGKVTNTRLLSFDLSNVADFLSDEEKAKVAGIDSLKTRIYLKREDEGKVKEVSILGGKFANPLKK